MTVWATGTGTNPHSVGLNLWVTNGNYVNWEVRVKATYSVEDGQTWQVWGAVAGSGTYQMSGPGERIVASGGFWGNRGQQYNFGARIGDIYGNNNNVPDVHDSITVPAIAPAPPSYGPYPSIILTQTAVRLAWGATTNDNGASPIEDNLIVRRVSDGVDVHNSVASGNVRDVTGLTPNTQYTAFARIRNAGGWSAFVQGTTWKTLSNTPTAPLAVTATRASDSQINLTWTNTSTAAAPYNAIGVERYDNVGAAWVRIGTPSGSSTSFTDSSVAANRAYKYRVWGDAGEGGVSNAGPKAESNTVQTTPAAPTSVTAVKNAVGNIDVTFTSASSYAAQHEVWHAADGVWDASALTTLASGVTTYTHSAPSNLVTHTYRVRAKSATPVLYSAYGTSGVVQLLAPPNAPTITGPTSAQDALPSVVLTWRHNPVDSTAQTKYVLRWRIQGATAWTTSAVTTSATQSATVTAWANGGAYEWQVQTYGQHVDPSPWSATGVVTTSTTPTATVSAPSGVVVAPTTTATWGYYQAQSSAQAGAEVRLLDAAGEVVETRVVTGAAKTQELSTVLPDGSFWTVTVRVRSAAGIWSAWASGSFTVAYPEPAPPIVSPVWDATQGVVTVAVENPAPISPSVINRVPNPRGENTTASWTWTYALGNGDGTQTWETSGGPLPECQRWRKIAVTTTATASTQSWYASGSTSASVNAPVTPGEVITGSLYLFHTRSDPNARIALIFYNAAGTAITTTNGYGSTVAGQWTRFVVTTVVPAGATHVRPIGGFVAAGGLTAGDVFGMAAVQVESGSVATAWFDGATTNASWTGAANASQSALAGPVRTNSARNPRAVSDTFGFYSLGTGGAGTTEYLTGRTDGPLPEITTYGRHTVTTAKTGGSSGWTATSASTRNPLTGGAGDVVTISAYVRYNGVGTTTGRMRAALFTPAGLALINSDAGVVTLNSGEWTRVSSTVVATGEYTSAGWWFYGTGTTQMMVLAGESIDATCSQIERGPDMTDYVDGDLPDITNAEGWRVTRSWLGTPNASSSQDVRTPALEVVSSDVYRMVDARDGWSLVASGVPRNGTILDRRAPAGGQPWYKAVAYSALPSSSESIPIQIAVAPWGHMHNGECSTYVSAGPDFSKICRARFEQKLTVVKGLADRTLMAFDGRDLPLEFSSALVDHNLTLNWVVLPEWHNDPESSDLEDWMELATLPGPHLFRDCQGRRIYTSISPIQARRNDDGTWAMTLSAREVARD